MICSSLMRPTQTSLAIILRARAYGESDKIVTFLTESSGKLTGIAKGAKNSRRRFANCLDPFTTVRVYFRVPPSAGLVFMESCDLLHPAGQLVDPAKFAYGSYLVELIDVFTAEAHPVPELYHLLSEGLGELEHGPATSTFLRAFELQVLVRAGYEPQLQMCGRCHRVLTPADGAFLDPEHGAIVCGACKQAGAAGVPISAATLASLDALKHAALGGTRAQSLPAATAIQAAQLTGHLLGQHISRPLRSIKLIAALAQ